MAGKARSGGIPAPDPIENSPLPPELMGDTYAPPHDSPNGALTAEDFQANIQRMMSEMQARMDELEDENQSLTMRLVQAEASAPMAVPPAGISPAVLAAAEDRTMAAAAGAGLIAPPTASPAVADPMLDPHRMVAFIPKEDLLNPKFVVFETFCNGKRIRIRRGSVGMLPLGHAIDLARSGHGHVVDIAALKSIDVQIAQLADPNAAPLRDPNAPVVPHEEYLKAFSG